MYRTVPTPMLNSVLLFHMCSAAVTNPAMSIGAQSAKAANEMFFRQNTTSKATAAQGSVLPRYTIYFGVGLFFENTRNGKKRVSSVAAIMARIVIKICLSVIVYAASFFVKAGRYTVSKSRIAAIAGIRKRSGPKISSAAAEHTKPISAGM